MLSLRYQRKIQLIYPISFGSSSHWKQLSRRRKSNNLTESMCLSWLMIKFTTWTTRTSTSKMKSKSSEIWKSLTNTSLTMMLRKTFKRWRSQMFDCQTNHHGSNSSNTCYLTTKTWNSYLFTQITSKATPLLRSRTKQAKRRWYQYMIE